MNTSFGVLCFLATISAALAVECYYCMGEKNCKEGKCTGDLCAKTVYFHADVDGDSRHYYDKHCVSNSTLNQYVGCQETTGNGKTDPIKHQCHCIESNCNGAGYSSAIAMFVMVGVVVGLLKN